MPPLERPGKIVAVGLNYRGHADEQGAQVPGRPLLFAKWHDTFCPVGELVPAAAVPDPQALRIRCLVNGELRQDSTTADMIFSVAELIAFVSEAITLEPGDLLLTGTPPGVGVFRDPPVFLADGDEVVVEIDGVGRLANPVRAA